MNIHLGKRLFLVATLLGALAVFATGFFVVLGVRSVVAGPDSAPAASPPNPGHSWSEIGDLPGTMWHSNNDGPGSGLDADMVDGHDTSYFQRRVGGTCSPGNSIKVINQDGTVSCETDDAGLTACSQCDGTFVNEADLDHLDAGDGSPANAVYVDNEGNVGIGTTNPGSYKLNVQGGSERGIYASGGDYGVYGSATNSVSFGVDGHSPYKGVQGTGGTFGVYGSGEDYGVYGYSDHGTAGVEGYSNTGKGVQGRGSTYDFYANGPGTNYGPFTGAHEVKLSDDFPASIRPGMIVCVTGETQVREIDQEKISFSSTLPTVRLSDTPSDSKVLGVLISESPLPEEHWYTSESDEGERFGIVNALGEGRVWVTNINGNIEAGDYITTSAIGGYGQKQDDDLIHSYTLGKATEDVDWSKVTETVEFNGHTYKAYPIAVVYTSG